jgi:menaquinone-dependent protoporphyrinogen oxidase
MVNYLGAKAVPIRLHEEKDFGLDVNELAALITDRTKLIILNSPQNPTGGVLSRQDIRDIAEAIGKELQLAGYEVDVIGVKSITTVAGYDAVVLGGPLYMGKVVGEVSKFVAKHETALRRIPVAAFAVGMAPVSKDAGQAEQAIRSLRSSITPLTAVADTVFAGRLEPAQLNVIIRKFMELAHIPSGDHRDWNAITDWAQEIASLLKSRL